ncbi:SGNH/GDSL hydrolase family protein [Ornithinimicrobium cerasi]|uniref:SGNH/GDSL hydrolase family protein n=1 Tax=Ornithinimicrobium cerasi TaxID=2248773 RepID=UPI000F00A12F|nr:SGNH/GDSL hydrolase family protein [Ornithinimicrobium cerasi]
MIGQGAGDGKVWERFVALGDSFTEGLSDPHPDEEDRYVGWADRVAATLAMHNSVRGRPFAYANLAIRGRLIDDVVVEQLGPALEMAPDLVSICAGGNDLLQSRTSVAHVVERVEDMVVRIRATGADVLLVTAPDVSWVSMVSRVHPRLVEYTAHAWALAQRTGCLVVDIFTLPSLRDPRMYHPDRIHLSSEGHARVAAQALWTLGLTPTGPGDWREPLGALPALSRREALLADRAWAVDHLRPWLRRHRGGHGGGEGRTAKRPELLPWDHEYDHERYEDSGR